MSNLLKSFQSSPSLSIAISLGSVIPIICNACSIDVQLSISFDVILELKSFFPPVRLYNHIAILRKKLKLNIILVISLINEIIAIKLKLNTVCITELIILILASTFSVETPNKLPAFPAVNPVNKSPTAKTASIVNPEAAPTPILVNRAVIFLANLGNILSANFNNFTNISSAYLTKLSANPGILGNFSAANSPILANACLPNFTSLFISPPSSAAPLTILLRALPELVSAAPLAIFASAIFTTFPAFLVTAFSPASLAALAEAKSITLSAVLVALTAFLFVK